MKLTIENIYINLQGKSKAELTELYNLLISLKQNMFDSLESDLVDINRGKWKCYEFYNEKWCLSNNVNKQEVTIQQLKEILQPMESKEFYLRGYSVEVDNEVQAKQLQEYAFKQGFEWYDGKNVCLLNKKFFNFNAFNYNLIHFDTMHFKDEYVTKEIHFNDIFKTNTLQEQLEKAEAEVKRLKEAIEDNRIKVDDWVVISETNTVFKVKDRDFTYIDHRHCKITDQELINKLNELIK